MSLFFITAARREIAIHWVKERGGKRTRENRYVTNSGDEYTIFTEFDHLRGMPREAEILIHESIQMWDWQKKEQLENQLLDRFKTIRTVRDHDKIVP